ncbi:MAG TPA: hypothetical protein VFA94_02905 [Acidimicrobiales bacterium]|nr:hypothetical protein [Acidimicrobiales bacterium]
MKKLAVLALVPAALAALAVPAGASVPTTRTTQTVPCAAGHQSATFVEKWQGGAVTKSWYTNPCAGEFLWLGGCNGESDCSADAAPPKTKGHLTYGADFAVLVPGPLCSTGTTPVTRLGDKHPAPPCPGS